MTSKIEFSNRSTPTTTPVGTSSQSRVTAARTASSSGRLSLLFGVKNTSRLGILILALACSGCVWRSDVNCATSGKVLDNTTKQPVPNARLYDKRYPKQVVMTSADGSFVFPRFMAWHQIQMIGHGPNLNTNQFLVVVAFGYQTAEVTMPLQFDWFNRIIYLRPASAP